MTGEKTMQEDAQVVLDAIKTAEDNLLPDRVLGPYFSKAELAAKRLMRVAKRLDPNP